MHPKILRLTALAASVLLIPSLQAQSDTTATGERSVLRGVFNAEQVARGRAGHRAQCSSCHGAEAYTGESFAKAWLGRTVFDFFDFVRSTMPEDSPGKLPIAEYVDIIAYVLNLNGYPQGETELPADETALKKVRIDSLPVRSPDQGSRR
ncbi:MAG: c-type cytochrome [Gemmatimonadaceae bacterium]